MENKVYLSQLKVLYVEDEEETLQELTTFLKRRVGKVYTAKDGRSGLEKYYEVKPDIVIADLLMPEIDGMKMLEEIRRADPECRIIITSSVNRTDIILEAVDLGIVKYALKPINLQEFDGILLRLAEDMMKKNSVAIVADLEEKKKLETELKKKVALFLKKETGKGPRDVNVFIHSSQIDIMAYDILTPIEKNLMRNQSNYNIVEQSRRYFYIVMKEELQMMINDLVGKPANLQSVEIHPDRAADKIVFSI